MNKKYLFLFLLILVPYTAFSIDIKIAPLAVYDSNGNKLAISVNPAKEIYTELEKQWYEGLISFMVLAESKYGIPLTVIDANKICTTEKSDYLLYGYVKKNEANWITEIKLYDYSQKKIVKEFFASDDSEHYDRMLGYIIQNILSGIGDVTGYQQNKIQKDSVRYAELKIPASIFYWSPIESDWGKRIFGIAGVNLGLELYPTQPKWVSKGGLIDFSLKLNTLWNIGINKEDFYPLIINTVAVSLPLFLHFHFDGKNSVYTGIGLSYEIEFMNIRPKYEDEQFLYQNIFTLENIFGYEISLNEVVNIFAEITLNYHLNGDRFVSIRPGLGVSFNVFKERK